MIYEFREYTAVPGNMKPLLERFEKQTIDIYKKHNIEPVGFFREDFPTQGKLVVILGFESYAQREKDRAAFLTDPEWREVYDSSEKEHGPLHFPVQNRILVPFPWSAMK